MTIHLPKPSVLDRLLRAMGKRRAVYVPPHGMEHKRDLYITARKESFLKALLRPRSRPLPQGAVDIYQFYEFQGIKELENTDKKRDGIE